MNETRQDPDPNPVGHPGAAYDIYAHGTEDHGIGKVVGELDVIRVS